MWFDTMKTVSKKWNSNETRTLVKEMKESDDVKRIVQEYYVDLHLWLTHFRSLDREPTMLEEELMRWVLESKAPVMGWIKKLKGMLKADEKKKKKDEKAAKNGGRKM